MDAKVEFPDSELSASPALGVIFRLPTQDNVDDSSDHDSYDDRRRCRIRPHSAKGPSLDLPSRVVPNKPKGIRPWSALPKTAKPSLPTQRKVSRQTLRKPHLRPPARSPTASISSEGSSLITAVGLANKKGFDTSTPDSERSFDRHAKCFTPESKHSSEKWAVKIAEAITEISETEPVEKPEPPKRSLRKHPSFETWIQGSPHDSDEYDTDIDIDDYVKRNIKEGRPIDPTGTVMYMDQCQVQGVIPVSYIQRHLGDKNLRMRHHYFGGTGTKPIAVALLKNTITENIDISDNYVEAEGARYIAGMLRNNTFITDLNISKNFIGRDGFSAICRMLESNTTLKTLCVSGNQLTDSCAQCLIEGLKNNTSLTSLDLSGNGFGEQGGIYIGGALSLNEGLIDIDCSWNSFRNRGGAALLSSLAKNRTIEVLDLSWNGLGSAGAEALKTALKINTTLKVLDLTNNRFNTKAAESISWGLSRNTGLETLVLNMNPLKDAGVEAVLKAVEKHPNLHLLSIEDIGMSRENYRKIQELQTEKDVTILHGGVGGYSRISTTTSMIRLFSKFVQSHQTQLGTSFHQFDRDRTGILGIDEVKTALKDAGLRLTNKQLSLVIEELNYKNSSTMNYKNILSGETLAEYFHERPSRLFAIKTSQIHINTVPEMLHRQLTVT
ncbi:leucine-rich repeat-containing protein 74A-like isoform X2 [Ruditapes philippinarum]|uniref:leucine-rich repeat-containing protein 74A-like isoform X2 n=1 Tax=Ruditapes philippinarum TaxID=129788 RepID=UPI00295ABB21|nr:leucine-rich repeat-containing protein 74A-like isoform X2 [Ruditapes philippinarum]